MKETELEKFIRTYLNNKQISETKEPGYASWIEKNGLNKAAEFGEGIAKAKMNYERFVSPFANTAEKNAENGISDSGYAAYLSDTAKGIRDNTLINQIQRHVGSNAKAITEFTEEKEAEAEKIKKENEAALKKEAELLEKQEKAKKSIYDTAKRGLEAAGIIDYDEAYKLALEMGVDKDGAKKLATTTTKIARAAAIDRVVRAIVNRTLTKSQTKEYALGLGLSEEDAEELSEIAYRTNESVMDMTAAKDYLDELKNKVN